MKKESSQLFKVRSDSVYVCLIEATGIFEASLKFNRKFPNANVAHFIIEKVEFDENGVSFDE